MASELKERGFHFTGTIRANRCHKAPLKSEQELKRMGRGAFDSVIETKTNKCVTLLSTYVGTDPVNKIKRYDRSTKSFIDVDQPAVIGIYNSKMGGVDLLDMMCTLYKRQLKSKRWYLYIFYHTLTIAVVNAWFLYRRDCKYLATVKTMPLKPFQGMVAASLVKKDNVVRGRHSGSTGLTPPPAKKQRVMPGPVNDARYDKTDHFPLHQEKRMGVDSVPKAIQVGGVPNAWFICVWFPNETALFHTMKNMVTRDCALFHTMKNIVTCDCA
ncbi:piggyBac transposable element-derived protein 2-like [Gigantopelta aegis]|nr:piggyBac transposable element-derived protein 2-like [Gigantopelta aegis]